MVQLTGKLTGSGGKSGSKSGTQASGNSSGAAPTEAANTLRSRSDAIMLFAACEGEIKGFVNEVDPFKSIYLDDTPIKNEDGSLNFQNIIIDHRVGTQYQPYISGMASSVENERGVSVQLRKASGAVVRTITDANVNAYRVRVSVPSLLDGQENIKESSVSFKIEIAPFGGTFTTQLQKTIKGKTSGAYEESYRLPVVGSPPWDIRLTRTSDDSNLTTVQNNLYWQSLTEIIDVKLNYPNTVLFGVRVSAEQFSSIPKLSVDLNLLKILIPTNYNPITRIYSGVFDGTLYKEWSDNPAWVYFDLVTNSRYGVGRFIKEEDMDVFDLYSIGQYCDELVPNGKGGMEPRFTCNALIQNRDDAFRVLSSVASCFRGMIFERNGILTAIQDRPQQPTRIYTQANVVCEFDESGQMTSPPFNYSGTGLDTRYTVVKVAYSEPTNGYQTAEEVVEDLDGINRYGYIPTDITAFGCASRGQAYRAGKWFLLSQQLLTQVVTFKVGAEGLLIEPGEVFKVMDSLKSLARIGGRIISATTTTVQLDGSVGILPGISYTLSIVKADGKIETRNVTNTSGDYTTLNVSPAYSEIPKHVWVLESSSVTSQLFRCSSVAETGQEHVYEISGTEYNPSIYDAVENSGFVISELPISGYPNPTIPPNVPGTISVVESLYAIIGSAGVKVRADILWSPSSSPFIDYYQVEYKETNQSQYLVLATTKDLSTIFFDISAGVYDFRVKAVNRYGSSSIYSKVTKEIKGLTTPPDFVTSFAIAYNGDFGTFTWDLSSSLDVQVGGYYKIKYTSKTSDVTWSDGIEIGLISGSTNIFQCAIQPGIYSIKAIDSSGNQSLTPAQITVGNFLDFINKNVVATLTESPTFPGVKNNTVATGVVLKLNSLDYFDAQPGFFDSYPGLFDNVVGYFDSLLGNFDLAEGDFDSAGQLFAVYPEGTYDFSSPIDLGYIAPVRISMNVSGYSINESILFDRTGGFFDDTTGMFDGQDNDNSSLEFQIATSNNGTTFSLFSPFVVTEYIARAFKFRLKLQSTNANHNYFVEQCAVTVDMPDRIESGDVSSSSSANTTYTFPKLFAVTPEIALTLLAAQPGDYVELVSKNNTGFVFNAKNSAGTRIVRVINFVAKGYGEIQ